jgi:NitT/TauT family transport system substrate-binding protein
VKLEWVPTGLHAWYHVAVAKGWYKEAGLDVTFEDGKGSAVGVQLVGSGKFEIGANISLATAAIGTVKGVPIKAIAAMAKKSDLGFLFPKGKGYRSPKDFVDAGAKIIVTPGDAWAPFLETIFKVGGTDIKNANVVHVGYSAKNSTYILGENTVLTTVPPYAMAVIAPKRASDFFMVSDIGLTLPGWGLIASDEALRKRPDEVRKFVSVTMKAFDYVINGHEAEGVDAIIAARPDVKLGRERAIETIKNYHFLFVDSSLKGKPSGYMSPDNWKASLGLMADVGLVPAGLDPTEIYSNDYLQ